MGLNLAQYIPFAIYFVSFIVAFLSIVVNPIIGVLFLFPLLPYQLIFEKIYAFPLGNNLNDIIIAAVLIGYLLKRNTTEKNALTMPILCVVITSMVGLVNALVKIGFSSTAVNIYLSDWKNYMLLPLLWFLTYKTVKDRKTINLLIVLMFIGILGADYYFYSNLKWMTAWHYSERLRNTMDGLFVYLGANHYGAFFVHFLFVLIGVFLFNKSLKIRIALFGLIVFDGYCLMYTYSRGAYIALMVGLFFIGLVKDRRLLLALVLFAIFWRSLIPVSVRERIEMTKNEEGELEDSAAIRLGLWQAATNMFQESPIIGIGLNTFQFEFKGELWKDTHNYYLKMLVELGIVGLLAFLYLLFTAFNLSWNLYRCSGDSLFKGLGLGFAACVVALAVTNLFGDRWSYLSLGSYFWIFLGLVTRARLITQPQGNTKAAYRGTKNKSIAINK